MKIINYALLLIIISTAFNACTPRMTDAERAQQQKIMQSILERQRLARENLLLKNAQLKVNTTSAGTTQQKVAIASSSSESDMKAEIDKLPLIPINTGVLFRKQEDGFTVNGKRFIDYEGEIDTFVFNGLSGNVTYVVETGEKDYTIKVARPSVSDKTITIATAKKERNTWKVHTKTGKNLTGSRLLMTSKGFVVIRKSTGFLYIPGEEIQSFTIPKGYTVAKYQTGDIYSTNLILIEKIQERTNSFGGLLSTTRGIAGIFGGDGNEDYALYNINNKKVISLNIDYSGDQKPYKYINQGNKSINALHYYWRIEWFKVPSGTYIVFVPNGIRKVNAIHAETGLKTTIFESALGFESIYSFIQENGKIKIIADMGLKVDSIDDLVTFLTKTVSAK